MRKILPFFLLSLPFMATALQPTMPASHTPQRAPRHEAQAAYTYPEQTEAETYNITMLIKENFNKFTQGEVGNPHPTPFDGFIPAEYTEMPGWSAVETYSAGGCVVVDLSKGYDANLSTPIIDIPLNGKPITVTFRSCLADERYQFDYPTVWMVDATDPQNPHIFTSDYAYSYNNDWREYRFVLNKERKAEKFFFQFTGYDTANYFDDIEIKFLDPKVSAPVTTGYRDFNDQGFTATWDTVDGASSYLVSLFTILPGRDKNREYILRNVETTDCHFTFTDIDTPHSTFYYTVKAVKDGIQSPDSEPVKVHTLTVPQNIAFSLTSDNCIEVTWDAVTGAEYYELTALRSKVAETDGEFILSQENFDRLVSPGKPSVPEYDLPINEILDEWTDQPGWVARNPAHINGAYGLIGYYYQVYGEACYLESPIMDLSADGGKVQLSVDLYAQQIDLYDKCTAVLRCLKLEKTASGTDRLTTTSSFETPLLEDSWKTFAVELNGGTAQSAVDICAKAGYLYIDNIKISQNLKAGEKITVPYYEGKTTTNNVKIPIYAFLQDNTLELTLRAVREIWDSGHYSVNEYVRSPYTETQHFHVNTAGLADIAVANNTLKAFTHDGNLIVVNPRGEAVEVVNAAGQTVAADNSGSPLLTLTLPQHGFYIVKTATQAAKVAY